MFPKIRCLIRQKWLALSIGVTLYNKQKLYFTFTFTCFDLYDFSINNTPALSSFNVSYIVHLGDTVDTYWVAKLGNNMTVDAPQATTGFIGLTSNKIYSGK